MEKCIWTAHTSSKLKKENEFKDCLIELKNYCLQLDEKSAERLSEQSWNYLIQHFTRQVDFEEFAIHCYQTIVVDKKIANPNLFTLKAILKVFSNRGDLEMCGQIFEKLKEQNEYSLYTVSQYVNACIKRRNLEKALNLIIEMKRNRIEPNYVIFIPMLKASTAMNNHQIGLEILKLIDNSNTAEIQLSMCVIKFALQAKIPQKVIEECEKLKKQKLMDVITWSCLMQAYIQLSEIEKAIQLLDEMEKNGTKPDSTTFIILITACANNKLLEQGKYLHSLVLKIIGNIGVELATSIVSFYTKCNQPQKAIEECEKLKKRKLMNTISWNCLIQAYIQLNEIEKAVQLIDEMEKNGVKPDSTTFIILITACANNKLIEQGENLHNLALKLEKIPIDLWNSILNMYTKCNQPQKAIEECEKLKKRRLMNTISWNCLIQAYIQLSEIEKAIQLLDEMEKNGTKLDSSTLNILITACAKFKLIEQGEYLHNLTLKLEKIPIDLWNSILNMYTKCNQPQKAIEIMNEIGHNFANVITWSCLIQAYIQMNETETAIQLLDEMEKNGVKPDSTTFIILITACANNKLIEQGEYLHNLALKLENIPIDLWNSILNMYTKCNQPQKTIEECEKLKKRKLMNTISWNCLIQAYIQLNEIEKAIQLIDEMKKNGVKPDSTTFIILITACANNNLIEQGEYLHNLTLKLENTPIDLWNSILNMYTKCNQPQKVIGECEKLKKRKLMNTISWNCLIQAYIQLCEIEKAIQLLDEMEKNSIKPDSTTFIILITACANNNLLEQGKYLHSLVLKTLGNIGVELATSIVSFYTKCNQPQKAIEECEKLQENGLMDVISWNCLMQAYIQMNEIEKAIQLIDEMEKNGVKPDSTTFIILITACANNKLIEQGEYLHNLALKLEKIPIDLWNSILNMYTKCNQPQKAIEECEKLKKRRLMNTISWNCLMQAYIQMNETEKAVQLIDEMEKNGVKPDSTTFIILITACANNNLLEQGEYLHNLTLKLEKTPIDLWNSILNMYTKCNQPQKAIEIMNQTDNNLMDVISWNCLIQAYIQLNEIEKAIQLLDEMEKSGIKPDSTTFIILITACANNKLLEQGEYLHNLALKLEKIPIDLWNSILNMYTKCNQPQKAIEECIHLRDKGLMDVVTCNCLINAHFQASNISSAFDSFQQMKLQNIEPDVFTYTILLSGCGDFVSQEKGLSIIQEIRNRGFEMHEEIISSMINFYSKVGEKPEVEKLIYSLQEKDSILSIITYNNILSHYAHHGNGIEAKKVFDGIVKNVEPNDQTFTIILNAFSHCGMISEAVNFFNDLELKYNHKPSIFNIGAMIDVYSRAGLFEQAELLIGDEMNFIWWNTVMGGCRKFNNIQVGERAFSKLRSIQSTESSPFILMSHIYTYHGLNEKAEMIRNLMEKNGIKKIPGIVYHEENGHTYKFISGSTDYERYEEVEKMRDEIYRKIIQAGFKPDTKWVTHTKQITEQEKIDALCKHAEKTAIAHALVLNPKRKKILLTKNLRVCNDCHNATEFISKVFDIEIIVRDANRYHHFVNGKCSCNNFW